MTEWFNFYSFDVMGDLGFAESFGMLESGDTHWAIQTLQSGLNAFGYYYPTWLVRTLRLLTTGKSAATNFKKFFVDQLEKRMKKQGSLDVLDISHYLIEHFQKSDPAAKQGLMPMLQGDSRLIIVAGSDTTAVTLTHLFYYLTTIPGLQEQVREEVRKLAKEDGTVSNTDLQTAELLNSCINETLRLHPPVPSGAPRKTPRDGVYLRETFIPADTVITMPWFAMGRGKLRALFTHFSFYPFPRSP
jgi:tryprostatin B 6-hydroxylase